MGDWFGQGVWVVLFPLLGFLRAYLIWLGCLAPGLYEVIQYTLSRGCIEYLGGGTRQGPGCRTGEAPGDRTAGAESHPDVCVPPARRVA